MDLNKLDNQKYIEYDEAPTGLNEDIIKLLISSKKLSWT